MGMHPDIMWEMRPVDFWRMWRVHEKKTRAKALEITYMISFGKLEDSEDFLHLYKNIWHELNEVPMIEEKRISMVEELGEEGIKRNSEEVYKHLGITPPGEN